MAEDQKVSAIAELRVERIKTLVDQIKSVISPLEELAATTDEVKNDIQQQLASYALSLKTTKLKPEELEAFFKKPYVVLPVPGKEDTFYLILPRFVDLQAGWLKTQTESYNVFVVNRYVEWLGALPEEIKRQLGFKPTLNLELQGDLLVGPRQDMQRAWDKYRPFFKDRDENKIIVNPRRAYELLVALVKDGILPFTPMPIPKEDFRDVKIDFELRDYQKEAWEVFKRFSHIGIYWPAGVGKTYEGMYFAAKTSPPSLFAMPTRLLVEQWQARIEAHTEIPSEDYIVCTYQQAFKKYGNGHPDGRVWGNLIIDEGHHLPAPQFSKMNLIKRKRTVGLTASPQREDGNEELMFAFFGQPVGLGWQFFREIGIIKSPTCHVWILRNFESKVSRIDGLLKDEKKTLIFADSIEIGKIVAARFKLPHVYGETKQRLSVIQDAPVSVVSRVADEGVSLPDIQRVIEVSWLFGSRRQELQRFTRLLHGETQEEGEHHILMTVDEYLHDRKRLFSVMDKGFKLEIHHQGVSEQEIAKRVQGPSPKLSRIPRVPSSRKEALSPPISAPPADEGVIAGILNLPGVKKIMASLNKSQQRVYELLLKNDGQWFKKTSLPFVLGYTSVHSMEVAVDFPSMVRKGIIEQSKSEDRETVYRTNLRAKVRASGG